MMGEWSTGASEDNLFASGELSNGKEDEENAQVNVSQQSQLVNCYMVDGLIDILKILKKSSYL